MRRDVAAAPSMQGVGVTPPDVEAPGRRIGGRPSGLRFDRLELVLLAAFALTSLWVLGLDLWQVLVHGQVWTGTDGSYSTDQLQYLAWIQSASRHVLVSNLFVLHGTPADYFQPAVAISGLLVAAGLSPAVALLVWKPVAVVGLFLAVRAFARSALPDAGRRAWAAVIALTLFYGSFTVVYGSFGVLGDLFPGFLSWGYPFALMAIAAAAFALVTYASARRERRFAWTPGLLGALASILHPWQGEVLVVTLVLAELTSAEVRSGLRSASWRSLLDSSRLRLALAALGGTLLPLLYYLALDKLDLSWNLGRTASKHGLATASIALALAPLALVALLGYRGRARTFTSLAARAWPLATILVFFQSASAAGATPLHAFGGITLPLAVLAVGGCLRVNWPRVRYGRALVVAVVLLATLPATGYELYVADLNARPTAGNANFITADERQALDYLRRDRTPGGVLTRFYLGSAVPARTGRHTFVGDCIWSEPGCSRRDAWARTLLMGQMPAAEARQFVRSTGARFVLSDCGADADLTQDLRPLLVSVHRFGCAAVYQLG
jgi:hypothetical protein